VLDTVENIHLQKSVFSFEEQNKYAFDLSLRWKIVDALQEIADKYPGQRLKPTDHIAVITEEWGESVADVLKGNYGHAKSELAQTIACMVRLYHELERIEAGIAVEEKDLYSNPF
jgi:hypothetical protein